MNSREMNVQYMSSREMNVQDIGSRDMDIHDISTREISGNGMSGHLLKIRNLHVSYETEHGLVNIVKGVSIHCDRSEKIALVGESGCGKTQTIRSILQILPPATVRYPEGEILYKGQNLLGMSEGGLQNVRRHGIAMIYQEPSSVLNPFFTIGQQMSDVIKYSDGRGLSKKELKERAMEMIRSVKIPDPERIFGYYPHQLSGGMKQRICIAMALSTKRDILLADEPGTALDVTIQNQVNELMTQMVDEREMALVLVTHSLAVARQMADRIYVMYGGTVVETASSDELFVRQFHPYTKGLIASIPKLTGEGVTRGIPGHVPDYNEMPRGCRFAPRCPFAMEQCKNEAPALMEMEGGHLAACFHLD